LWLVQPFPPQDRFPVFGGRYDLRRAGLAVARRGKLLLPPLIEAPRPLGMHAVLVGIDSESKASIRLYARFGFREVARFREAGKKSVGGWMRSL
jgi:L-amino acid N-acyltransferase YncA